MTIDAPANTRALAGIDPELVLRAARARRPIQAARLARRWCATIWPTAALAQQAGMSERDYEALVRRALFLDRPDPVAAWRELSARQAGLVRRLQGARELRIEAEGTDLRLRVDGRAWINSDGRRNMPSGEVFTGPAGGLGDRHDPLRRAVAGARRARRGVAADVRARPRRSRRRAERGERPPARGAAQRSGRGFLGELGIGTNIGIERATGSTLLDEKIAGTVHLALGHSYPETGALNVSALHWDLICDLRKGGQLTVDGRVLIRSGAIVE